MNILFIHDVFPGQFGHIGLELKKRYNWKCDFMFNSFSNLPYPTDEMIKAFNLYQLPITNYERAPSHVEKCKNVHDALRINKLKPDLIVAHGINGAPTLFIKNIPIIIYCEYFNNSLKDQGEYKPTEINNNILMSLNNCVAGYSPLNWTKSLFPEKYQSKIQVIFDGIDTDFWSPGIKDIAAKENNIIITFCARGLEPLRGFNTFMRIAEQLYQKYDNIYFIVIGNEKIYYSSPGIEIIDKNDYNLSKFIFAGQVPQEQLRNILRLSDLHLYLSKPYVVSWSLFNAMSCGIPVLALDTPSIEEIGILFGSENDLFEYTIEILNDPMDLGINNRDTIKGKYSLDICIPQFKEFFESSV